MNLRFLLLFLATFAASGRHAGAVEPRPHIVIILADDMGFSDISCYGGEIPTPHLDALAAGGLRFSQFYNAGRCCPTRASLLTGLYAHQAGVGHMTGNAGVPGYEGALNDRCVTLGRVASSAGYLTAVSGKWHVGHEDRGRWPLGRGFDRFYGIPEGGGFYFQVKKGRSVVLNEEVLADPDRPLPEGWYSTDAFTLNALNFVDEAQAAKKPFLIYLAHNAPHFPLQADREDIAQFRGKFSKGWDYLARERYRRQVEMGLIQPEWKPAGRPGDVSAWAEVPEEKRERFDHLMATYAATIQRMDRSIGRFVEGLKERGVFDDTLILFLSDNGASAESGPKGRTEGDPTQAESIWWAGKSWAWMSNAPFRRFKKNTDEGGIATPLIAHWPNGIADRGGWRHQPAHVIDLMATVVEATGATYPEDRKGVPIIPFEGVSLQPILQGDDSGEDRALFWEHEGNAAVREGRWKLVRVGGNGDWELYDLEADRTEHHDLAATHPERVAAMAASWMRWAERCQVSPHGLPRKKR